MSSSVVGVVICNPACQCSPSAVRWVPPFSLDEGGGGGVKRFSFTVPSGAKILGLPVVESPKPGVIRRLYAISRLRRDLEDLEVAQCIFAGDEVTNPNHVAVIANGNGVSVHHYLHPVAGSEAAKIGAGLFVTSQG